MARATKSRAASRVRIPEMGSSRDTNPRLSPATGAKNFGRRLASTTSRSGSSSAPSHSARRGNSSLDHGRRWAVSNCFSVSVIRRRPVSPNGLFQPCIHNEFADGLQIVTFLGRFGDAEPPEELRPSFRMLELTGAQRAAEQDRRVVLDRDAPAVARVDRRHVVHISVRPQRARNVGRLLGNGDLRPRRARCLRGGRRGVGRALGGLYHQEYAHGNHLSQLQNR